MGVAALGMMMGQLQEANKDDYNTGAMLKQVGGVTEQAQGQQQSMANQGVGSMIQNLISGSPQMAQAGTNQDNGGAMPQLGGLGGMIQQLMTQPKQQPDDDKQKAAQNNNTPYQSGNYSPGNGLASSNWSY